MLKFQQFKYLFLDKMVIVQKVSKILIGIMLALTCMLMGQSFASSKLPMGQKLTTNKALKVSTETNDETTASFDSFGRDTPRQSLWGLLSAYANEDEQLGLHYLDGKYLAKKGIDDTETLKRLKTALDVGGRLYPELQISDNKEGDVHDLLPTDVDKVGEISTDKGRLDILMVRRADDKGNFYWQISGTTLKQLPIIEQKKANFADKFAIEGLKTHKIFGFSVSDVLALIVLVGISMTVVFGLVWLVFHALKWLYPKMSRRAFTITPRIILPLSLVIVAVFLPEITLKAGVPVTLRASVDRIKEGVAWAAMTWLVIRVLDAIFFHAQEISIKKNRPEQVSILGLLRKLAKVLLFIIAVIVVFGNLGFDLTTGIAALGIGGLALAFGAQKTIENLIGSLVVVADRPVHIGDYCKFGNYAGTVIDIGIRSTRVRTLDRTIVTIPNGEFSSLQIENYTARDMFHFLHNFYVKRSTSADKLAELLTTLKDYLRTHQAVNDTWTQVRISELRQDAIVLEVRCYIDALEVSEFYDKQSMLIVQLLDKIAKLGVEQALPTYEINVRDNKMADDTDL